MNFANSVRRTVLFVLFRTNLPKELMDYPDFPYEGLDDVSFLKSWQVQEYIERFAEHFALEKHIRVILTRTYIQVSQRDSSDFKKPYLF